MGWRDIKRAARRDVHEHMRVPALYILGAADPVGVSVRLHTKLGPVGAAGAPAPSSEREEFIPQIRFDRDEASPVRGAIISIATGEAYRVDRKMADDDEFVSVAVIQLTASEASGLPVPE